MGATSNQAGSGDPLLVDLQKGDYHLKADSPLRGKGINLSKFYKTDFDGRPLPKTGKWDIGAIQYSATTSVNFTRRMFRCPRAS